MNQDNNLELEIWDKKQDSLISMLQNEYSICIESLRNVDEKANKYLTVLSIIFAATFTALSSSLTDNIKFAVKCMSLINILSIGFVLFLILGIFYGGKTFLSLLSSIKLIKTERMPTYKEILDNNDVPTVQDLKGVLIQYYQKAIDEIKQATLFKQKYINQAEKDIFYCSLFLLITLTFLIFIKIIGNQ